VLAHLRVNLSLLGLTLLVCAVLYPLAVWGAGWVAFPTRAAGSLVSGPDGKPVGSRLIAQEFKGEEWFQPRPSAAGYNAAASSGSNLSANNPKLRERVAETLKSRSEQAGVPADAVTASGSGLDPDVTRKNADGQLDRVVAAWARKTNTDPGRVRGVVAEVLDAATFEPLWGLAGGDRLVNVVEVNAELSRRLGR
jgi:K+-transporting ATPase ATPase C chain